MLLVMRACLKKRKLENTKTDDNIQRQKKKKQNKTLSVMYDQAEEQSQFGMLSSDCINFSPD
jgi:CRISPR/Cas system CSM-associated protein Csm5 (group 7 of RAMP superfamily)